MHACNTFWLLLNPHTLILYFNKILQWLIHIVKCRKYRPNRTFVNAQVKTEQNKTKTTLHLAWRYKNKTGLGEELRGRSFEFLSYVWWGVKRRTVQVSVRCSNAVHWRKSSARIHVCHKSHPKSMSTLACRGVEKKQGEDEEDRRFINPQSW